MERVHIIGIAGLGMSSTALLLKEAGYAVSGSDEGAYGPALRAVVDTGIPFNSSYAAANIPEDADFFIVGKNAKLRMENVEVAAAHATGKAVRSFPEVLGELTKDRTNVVVVGSYGKSTTTSLIAHLIRHAGTDAGYFVGAQPVGMPPAAVGSAPTFVLEGDEYPSGHDDARAKFMHLHPKDVVMTSLVHDHVNVYPTIESYAEPFRDLLALVPKDGLVVVCADEPGALALAEASGKPLITYGVDAGMYAARTISYGPRTHFDLTKEGEKVATLETTLLGRHNVEDIVGACAYVLSRGLVPVEKLPDAVASFTGVRRRLDNIAPSSSVPVYEGFGSSYEKARSAIEALLLHFPTHKLVIVFEPHTFGWRNRANLPWYDDVFKGAGAVYIAPPESQGAGTHDQLAHEEILERTKATGIEVKAFDPGHPEQTVLGLSAHDVVLILSSGDLGGALEPFAAAVAARFPH